jgi:hypothetical protein
MTGSLTPEIFCQQALERVLTYLGDDGVTLTTDTCRQALSLVESALAEGVGPDLPARCIDRIPYYFELHCEVILNASPMLKRGRIGYD